MNVCNLEDLINHTACKLDQNGSFLIINKQVKGVNEVDILKNKPFNILVVILSAPKNYEKRQITRNQLKTVSNRGVKWAFIIGQTSKEIQVRNLHIFLIFL